MRAKTHRKKGREPVWGRSCVWEKMEEVKGRPFEPVRAWRKAERGEWNRRPASKQRARGDGRV